MLHCTTRLFILELQNELVSFFCYAPNCVLSFVILFPQWWSEMKKAWESYHTMISASVFVQQLKYHTHLLPLPNINYWDGARRTSWCRTPDGCILYAIAKQNWLSASNSSFFYLRSSIQQEAGQEEEMWKMWQLPWNESDFEQGKILYFIFQADAAEYFIGKVSTVGSYRHSDAPWG